MTNFKSLLLAFAVSVSALSFAQEQLPKWAADLQTLNPGLVDSILYYNADPHAPNTRTYVVYYNQPLKHANAAGVHFPLRALITVQKNGDPTTAVNHVYASGYSIEQEFLASPDSTFVEEKESCSAEIAHRYKGNYIQIEHRYFQESAPAECWTILDDLRAEEAAADFHAFFEALKKVLKGKYVMSGVSKGGITTLLQHRFYPNDMDIYVPYAAPFFDTDRDSTMYQYWYTTGWSPEFQEIFMNVRKHGIVEQETIFPIYLKMCGGAKRESERDSAYMYYLSGVAGFGYEEHAYSDTASIRAMLYRNDSIMRAKNISGYGDTVYAFMFHKSRFSLDKFPEWIDTLRKYPEPNHAPKAQSRHRLHRPFGITYDQWWNNDSVNAHAYEYQAKCELGYYDIRFDRIIEDPATAAYYNNLWRQKVGCQLDQDNPYYSGLQFNPSLYHATMTATQNATKPIVLIYGLDDAWTGAAVKDQYINGTTVHKFILPAQNHLVAFSSNTDKTQCDAIRAILDGVLGNPQDLEQIVNRQSSNRKFIKDGQLFIERNGKVYDATGRLVK